MRQSSKSQQRQTLDNTLEQHDEAQPLQLESATEITDQVPSDNTGLSKTSTQKILKSLKRSDRSANKFYHDQVKYD